MNWVYLSPHFDDVALSCGGLVWEQAQAGIDVGIWTVCAANPPPGELSPFAQSLHARWETGEAATALRRQEDANSCRRLGATRHYFELQDCIYRRHQLNGQYLYTSEAALNGPLRPGDEFNLATFLKELSRQIRPDMILVGPLALGNHVDHQLTRLALEETGHPAWYYPDYPYVERHQAQLEELEQAGWVSQAFPISPRGLRAWQESIAAHRSQISTFWRDEEEMRAAIADYSSRNQGIHLWRRPGA